MTTKFKKFHPIEFRVRWNFVGWFPLWPASFFRDVRFDSSCIHPKQLKKLRKGWSHPESISLNRRLVHGGYNPLIRAYLLGGWHWRGNLKFPCNIETMGATVWKQSMFPTSMIIGKNNILPIDHFFEDIFRQSWPDTSKKYHPLSSEAPRRYTSSEFNMEPTNEGVVQMFFPFKRVIFRFKNASFPGCNSQSPWKVAFFSEMILSLLGLCFDLFFRGDLAISFREGFFPSYQRTWQWNIQWIHSPESRIPVANENLG